MKISVTTALGFMFSLTSVFAVPIKERAIKVATVYETTTEVVEATSTVWVAGPPEGAQTPTPSYDPGRTKKYGYETPSMTAPEVTVGAPTSSSSATPSTSSTSPPPSSSSSPSPPPPSSSPSKPTTASTTESTATSSSISIPSSTIETTVPPTLTPIATPTPVVPTTTAAASTSVVQKAVETTAASSGVTFTGDATYYDVGLGSCGQTSQPGDYIVAASWKYMGASPGGNPNNNPHCGEKVVCQLARGGPTITVTIVDTCMGCDTPDLDFSSGAFAALGCTQSEGRCKLNCYKS